MNKILTAEDFGMQFDTEHYFAFIETEDATIMAWGHRDPAVFVDEVFAYDKLCSDDAERHSPGDVRHVWAVELADENAEEDADSDPDDDLWWISWDGVTEQTPGAFAVTVVQR